MAIHHIQVVLMEEASAFVRSLPLKVQEKITYNYKKIEQGVMDKELFKKLETPTFGSSARCIMAIVTASFPFGTQRRKRWSLPRMA